MYQKPKTNSSLVDGFTIGLKIDFPDNDECATRTCSATPWLGDGPANAPLCPLENLWYTNGSSPSSINSIAFDEIAGCKSNCSLHGTDAACCTGEYLDPKLCVTQNPLFRQVCPEAYDFAYRNDTLRACGINTQNSTMRITFGPSTVQ